MEDWQKWLVLGFGLYSFLGFLIGLRECKNKKKAYVDAHIFKLTGGLVWGDLVIFGPFWFLISLVVYYLNDWLLFLLILSVFWVVRSFGETIYWFNQQFSKVIRHPPEKDFFYRILGDDSVWFVNQIIWQCATVIAIILSLYFAKLWLFS